MGDLPHSFRTVLPVVVCGVLLAGCGADAVSAPSTTPTQPVAAASRSASRPVSASRSASPSVKVDPGQQAAMDKVAEFMAMLTKIAGDPNSNVNDFHQVARGESANQWLKDLLTYHSVGWHSTGEFKLKFVSAKRGESASQWVLTYCVDRSKVDLVDNSGKSVITETSANFTNVYTVEQDTATSKWYVVKDEEIKHEC